MKTKQIMIGAAIAGAVALGIFIAPSDGGRAYRALVAHDAKTAAPQLDAAEQGPDEKHSAWHYLVACNEKPISQLTVDELQNCDGLVRRQ